MDSLEDFLIFPVNDQSLFGLFLLCRAHVVRLLSLGKDRPVHRQRLPRNKAGDKQVFPNDMVSSRMGNRNKRSSPCPSFQNTLLLCSKQLGREVEDGVVAGRCD